MSYNRVFGQQPAAHPLELAGVGNSKRFAPTNTILGDKENTSNDRYGARPQTAKDNKYNLPDSKRTLFPEYNTEVVNTFTGKARVDPNQYQYNRGDENSNSRMYKNYESGRDYQEPSKKSSGGHKFVPLEDRAHNEPRHHEQTYGGKQQYRQEPQRDDYNRNYNKYDRQERKSPIRQRSPVKQQRQQSPVRQNREKSPYRQQNRQRSPVRENREEYRQEQKSYQQEQPTHHNYKQRYDMYSSINCLPGAYNQREDPSHQHHYSRKIGPKHESTRDIIGGGDRKLGDSEPEYAKRIPLTKALRNQESDNVFEAKERVDPMTKNRQFSDNRGKLLAQSEDEFFVLKGHHPRARPATASQQNVFKSSLQYLA